jgi:hypothetical protein
VVDLPFFSDFIDVRRQDPRQHGNVPDRRATSTCASLRTTGLFIDSQSLVGYGAFSDFAMQWWRLDVSSGVRLDGAGVGRRPLTMVVAGDPMDRFVFLDLLVFYLQIQDNHFIPVCLLLSTCVIYCNWAFD